MVKIPVEFRSVLSCLTMGHHRTGETGQFAIVSPHIASTVHYRLLLIPTDLVGHCHTKVGIG